MLGFALGVAVAPGAMAQSVDIPLQLAQSADGVRLIVNVGIGGAGPRSYLFDTGSSLFNAAYSASAFGSVPSNMSLPTNLFPNGLPTGVSYSYTSGNTFTGNLVGAPSLTFYSTSSTPTGFPAVTLNAITPAGAQSAFIINAVYSRNGLPIGSVTPLQTIPGVFGGIYGIFGAGDFAQYKTGTAPGVAGVTANTSTAAFGSVLGQAVVPGASAGYVVAANGQPLTELQTGTTANPGASVNGPQVGQNVTACSPCVMLGLTPALLAQFKSVNTLAWTAPPNQNAPTQFPNSGAPSSWEYGVNLNYSTSGANALSWRNRPSLLDTGTPSYSLGDEGATPGSHGGGSGSGQTTLTIAGADAGASPSTVTVFPTGSYPYVSPYSLTLNNNSTDNIVGIGFFLQNSVLENLAGQTVGYTPNFVTDVNIPTTNAAPLVIGSNSVPLGLAGIISGVGGVSIASGGSATLSGANTYTGATTINGGKLALVGPGSIAASSGVNVSLAGTFDISGTNYGAWITTLGGDSTGAVTLGSRTLTLSNASTAFNGIIGGSGGLTLTAGTETLGGVNTYTGSTTIEGGMLVVNGSLTQSFLTWVDGGGALSGVGALSKIEVLEGGVFQPGSGAPGSSINVGGALGLSPGSIYVVNLNPSIASFANVSGSAAPHGATVAALYSGGSIAKQQYTILSAAGGVFGTFNPQVAGLPDLTAALSYDATHAYLDIIGLNYGQSGPLNANQQNVAHALSGYFNATGAIPTAFGTLSPGGLTQISGQAATGVQGATFSAMNSFIDMFFNGGGVGDYGLVGARATQGGALFYDAPTPGQSAPGALAALTSVDQRAAAVATPAWSVWSQAYGGSSTTSGNSGAGSSTTASHAYGIVVGADYQLAPDTVVGFGFGGGGTGFGISNGLGGGNSDLLQAGLYGIHNFGSAYIGAAAAYGWQDVTTNRTVTVGTGGALQAKFNVNTFEARAEIGDRIPAPVLGFAPYGALQATSLLLPAYSESALSGDNGFALNYASQTVTDARTELGARFDKSFDLSESVLTLGARLAWAHDFNPNVSATATLQSLPGASFVVNGATPSPNSVLVSAGMEMKWANGLFVRANFEGDFSNNTRSYGGRGALGAIW
ncbi:autotransporter domain-containing protein [Methylocapsa sp. S129]|uniref:autotransporter outer membrane beta-barrel domain-containing protein n=1 Tax=Methylocapsa sp. S129 TaxID=1641869 RepID=UPI00131BC8AA|nr:autotransporter domain-containing protein [Methylocapsa sp. S129]